MLAAMPPVRRLSTGRVAVEAVAIVDQQGYDTLSVSGVAEALDVAPSALYTYCDGVAGLRNLVAVQATRNLTREVRDAATGAAGETALDAMADAYRSFAARFPGQFAATLSPPRRDDHDLAEADADLLDVFVLVYGAMGFDADRSRSAARSTRSAIHGFLALEHTAAPGSSDDRDYQHLLQAVYAGLVR